MQNNKTTKRKTRLEKYGYEKPQRFCPHSKKSTCSSGRKVSTLLARLPQRDYK
jgi:hypothetical protein